jgi:hypothetical protein
MFSRLILAIACFPLALSMPAGDYDKLNAGEALVEVLPGEGRNVALRAATRIDASADRLISWTRRVADLQKGPYVSAIGRFSHPPRLEDLDGLLLDDEDLNDLRRCRPGKCGIKLSDAEILRAREAIAAAEGDWKPAAQQAFRAMVLARATRYVAEGHTAYASYHDARKPVMLDGEFAALASEIALSHPKLFPLTNYLSLYPTGEMADIESFLYWSKESLGAKPIVSITHVAMITSRNPFATEAVVAKKQVYASHYLFASISFTAIGMSRDGAHRYLVYLNYSRSDVFDGLFGGLIRRIIERRLREEGPKALQTMRHRLESGDP